MRRWLGVAAVVAASCGPENGLTGSAGELFPLDISRVEIARNQEALQLTYLRNRGASIDVVAQVGISLADVTLHAGVKLPLEGEYAPGHPRTTVVHAPGGEPQRLLPRVKKGDLSIAAGGEAGQVLRGSFSVLFESEGGDLGAGRTLGGTFSGLTADAGFGLLP